MTHIFLADSGYSFGDETLPPAALGLEVTASVPLCHRSAFKGRQGSLQTLGGNWVGVDGKLQALLCRDASSRLASERLSIRSWFARAPSTIFLKRILLQACSHFTLSLGRFPRDIWALFHWLRCDTICSELG